MLIIGVKVKELEWIKATICSVQLTALTTYTYTGNIMSFLIEELVVLSFNLFLTKNKQNWNVNDESLFCLWAAVPR